MGALFAKVLYWRSISATTPTRPAQSTGSWRALYTASQGQCRASLHDREFIESRADRLHAEAMALG